MSIFVHDPSLHAAIWVPIKTPQGFHPWKYLMQFRDETENSNKDTAMAENAIAGDKLPSHCSFYKFSILWSAMIGWRKNGLPMPIGVSAISCCYHGNIPSFPSHGCGDMEKA